MERVGQEWAEVAWDVRISLQRLDRDQSRHHSLLRSLGLRGVENIKLIQNDIY